MNERRTLCPRLISIIIAAFFAWLPVSAENDWTLLQVTDLQPPGDYSMSFPALSGNGRTVAVYCNLDLGGLNPDGGTEVFLLDVLSGEYTAATDIDGLFTTSVPPTVDATGATVGHFGDGGVYLWQTAGASTVIDPSQTLSVVNPTGAWLAFTSTLDLTGENADGSPEIFLYDVVEASYRQITNLSGIHAFALPVQVSTDGTRVAFRSEGDFTGDNGDGGVDLFLWYDDGEAEGYVQFSNLGASDSLGDPGCSDDALRCVFATQADMLGENPDRNYEVFVVDLAVGAAAQVTDTVGGGFQKYPGISGDGSRIALIATLDIADGNPDGSSELLVYDLGTSTWSQITDITTSQGLWGAPSVDFSGHRIAFMGGGDITGGDPDLSAEVYLAIEERVFSDGFESGDLSVWSATEQ